MGFFGLFRRAKEILRGKGKSERSMYPRCIVEYDETGVTCTYPDGHAESVAWVDLRVVTIQNTSDGPFVDDIFWILIGAAGGCVVPSESVGMQALQTRLGQLPGFNWEAAIASVTCTDDREFLCWKSGG